MTPVVDFNAINNYLNSYSDLSVTRIVRTEVPGVEGV